jgi:hypothetical protein
MEAIMLKRLLLSLTFLAAFTTAGVGITNSAEAWRGWGGRPYMSYYYGPPRTYYYNSYMPYRAYYGPRVYRPYSYYPRYYYYGEPGYDYYYYGARPGVRVSFRY